MTSDDSFTNLSKKAEGLAFGVNWYSEDNIKEFIKKLKLKIAYIKNKDGFFVFDENGAWLQKLIFKEINKLAGNKLI